MSQYFLVAAGGTGMRCLQSFIQLCALGMFPKKNITILLMETDAENKDKANAEQLLTWYNYLQGKAKAEEPKDKSNDGTENKGAESSMVGDYFSANIDLCLFVPDYSRDDSRSFKVLSQVERGNSEVNHKLANIFYEEGVQEFDLGHGYRAQTHLGSYLMYHAIIQEIRTAISDDMFKGKSELYRFISKVQTASAGDGARVFALGSTFGGTGASAIPIITRAITDSCKILTGDKISMEKIYYGAVVLSAYFKFPPPSDNHLKKDKVIANSIFFEHNSASALMYYVNDGTIKKTYKRMYILGWGGKGFIWNNTDDYKIEFLGKPKNATDKTATGGKAQENPCHVLELLAAFSAKHFFEEQTTPSLALPDIMETQFRYKSFELDGIGDNLMPKIEWDDLFSVQKPAKQDSTGAVKIHDQMKDNFVGMVIFAAIINSAFEGKVSNFLSCLQAHGKTFELTEKETESIDAYLQYFYSSKSQQNDGVVPGWFKQIYLTFHSIKSEPGKMFLGIPSGVLSANESGEKWYLALDRNGLDAKKAQNLFISEFLRTAVSGKFNELISGIRATVTAIGIKNELAETLIEKK